jgi:H+/Cl- antiporter ClcA
MADPASPPLALYRVPATLSAPGALRFWLAVLLTGIGTGIGATALTRLLEVVQRRFWTGNGVDLLDAALQTSPRTHVLNLVCAGVLTGVGQVVLKRLTSSNSIDITEAIWFRAGRLPWIRTLGSAVLSIVIVGMGVSLGREGAPKQTGAVLADALSSRGRLSDDERRLLVACGAGSGMAAAYGVPLGGALFALEVLRGALALRLVLPALLTSLTATAVSWIVLPDRPVYVIPSYPSSISSGIGALVIGVIAGLVSVEYVRMIGLADRNKPQGWMRIVAPVFALALLGGVSIVFPQLLGNGKDIAQLAFSGEASLGLLLPLVILKPAVTALCLGSGAPGGLFTPSLSFGAILGGIVGQVWMALWPGSPPGLFALLGAGAVLAATTQGPISSVVLMLELTGRDRSFILPLLLTVVTATLVSRSIEPRSIYEVRLTEEQVRERMRARDGIRV